MTSSGRALDLPAHAEGSATGRRHGVAPQWFRLLAGLALSLGIPSAIVGFTLDDPLFLAASAALIGCGSLATDMARFRSGGVTPLTFYTFTWTLGSFANAAAVLNQDTADRALYFLYAVDEHLPLAMKIAWMGLVMPILGFRWVMHSPSWRSLGNGMPQVRGNIGDRQLLLLCVIGAGFAVAANVTNVLPSLGTLTALLFFLPHIAAFTLARRGIMRGWSTAVWVGLAIAVVESTRALITAYLRVDIMSPIFAYAAGVLIGGRSLRALRSVYMIPVYAVAVPFVVYFAAFAEVRGSASGVARIAVVQERQEAQIAAGESSSQRLVTRLSNINQLTQVARVVEEDGLRQGETLEYLAYAWIPRFLWPEKPVIAKGAWFAYRIGQARIFQGRITNSINMTIPGEFYLNFGWIGLLLGPFAFGGLLALFWQTTSFWERPQDALGSAFGFYLIWVGAFGGADLQIVITLVAVYLIFVVASQFSGGPRSYDLLRGAPRPAPSSGRGQPE
jgi:hypothetical protein